MEDLVAGQLVAIALLLMIVPKLIGVAGVITLPATIVSSFIFVVVSVYAVSYILDRPFKSNIKWLDAAFMILGGYVSGTSLIAAPLVVPVAASRVESYQLRDTLFVLWFVLVALKLGAFVWTGPLAPESTLTIACLELGLFFLSIGSDKG